MSAQRIHVPRAPPCVVGLPRIHLEPLSHLEVGDNAAVAGDQTWSTHQTGVDGLAELDHLWRVPVRIWALCFFGAKRAVGVTNGRGVGRRRAAGKLASISAAVFGPHPGPRPTEGPPGRSCGWGCSGPTQAPGRLRARLAVRAVGGLTKDSCDWARLCAGGCLTRRSKPSRLQNIRKWSPHCWPVCVCAFHGVAWRDGQGGACAHVGGGLIDLRAMNVRTRPGNAMDMRANLRPRRPLS